MLREDIVSLRLENPFDMVLSLWSLFRLQAIAMPISFKFPLSYYNKLLEVKKQERKEANKVSKKDKTPRANIPRK